MNKGQTLLESVIALSAILLIIGAVSGAIITSVNNSTFIRNQNQANKLAQQGMEYIRNKIVNPDCDGGTSSNCNSFADYLAVGNSATKTMCLGDITTAYPLSQCTGANVGIYRRTTTFTSVTNCGDISSFTDGLEVAVDVYWTSGKCSTPFCHKQELKSCFLNPYKISPTGGQGI